MLLYVICLYNDRYFYYELINIYVLVGFGGMNVVKELYLILQSPQALPHQIGISLPTVSLYFCNFLIVKIFLALPIEMMRPWQLSTILLMGKCMNRQKTTRRELRTGDISTLLQAFLHIPCGVWSIVYIVVLCNGATYLVVRRFLCLANVVRVDISESAVCIDDYGIACLQFLCVIIMNAFMFINNCCYR